VNVRRDRKCEGPQGDSQRYAQCCCPWRTALPNVFVRYVRRESGRADHPGGKPPRNPNLIGRSPIGKRREGDAGNKVHDAQEYHSPEPL